MTDFSRELKTPLDKVIEHVNEVKWGKDKEALEYLLADSRGRWFLMRLYERCHIFDSTYPDSDHIERMLVYEGERRVALDIQDNVMNGLRAVDKKAQAEKEYQDTMYSLNNLIDVARADEKERMEHDGPYVSI